MTDTNNNQDIAQIGRTATSMLRQGEKGEGLAVYALFLAAHRSTFSTIVLNRKGEETARDTFTIEDMLPASAPKNEDGTKNTALMNARLRTVALEVFGIKEPTPAQKQKIFVRALPVAVQLALTYDASEITTNRTNELVVPFNAVNKPLAADATDEDKAERALDEQKRVTLNGKKGRSMAELVRNVMPKKERAAHANGDTNKGAAFVASLDFVTASVHRIIEGEQKDDEAAPTDEVRRKMHELQLQLTAYFAEDPMEDEVETRKAG